MEHLAEYELRERLAAIVDSSDDAIISKTMDGTISAWNRGAEKVFGYSAAEMVGNSVLVLLPPDRIDEEFAILARIKRGETVDHFETTRVRKDGTNIDISVTVSPVRDSNGVIVGASKVARDISDRKRAHELRERLAATERQKTQQRLDEQACILEAANDSIMIRDSQDRITYWNRGAERLYGWSKEEAIGHVTHELFRTEFPRPLEVIMAQLLAEGNWRGELLHTRRDGSLITVSTNWTLQRDNAGHSSSVVEINFDLTARKRTEEQLEKTQARMSAIFNGSLDGVIVFEPIEDQAGVLRDLQFVMINPAAVKLMEVDAAALIRKGLVESFPNTAHDGLFNNLARTIHNGIPFDEEYLSLRREAPHWYRTSGVKLGDGVVLTYTDITQRKHAEDKLKTVVRRLGLATAALHSGVWDWDTRTDAVLWDERMCEIYGMPPRTQANYPLWRNAVLPEDLASAEATLEAVIAAKSEGSMEFRIRLPDGSIRFIQAAMGTILDDTGKVARIIGINIDTTGRKFNEDLERQVDERTAQLKAANIELEEFAYAASHDLKAPLRVIHNASMWIQEDLEANLTAEIGENMTLLRSRVRRMDRLLDDLLEYSRIGRNTDSSPGQAISGTVLMENILGLLAPPEGFKISATAAFAGIKVSRMPLQQILINLISNAIKHHDKKAAHIEVSVEDLGSMFRFHVKDDGPGIPAQYQEQIFKMFHTLKPKDQVEGSGMGLAMVRKHVGVAGGELKLESAVDHGSTFSFTWPKQNMNTQNTNYSFAKRE